MPNSLADALSPYLRLHAGNPVAWQQWGSEPFAEAVRRDVPVFVSIGYSTCHWCHVMARESFSDPVIAEYVNTHFVAIKVDREEHPEVDSSYLNAASAFTQNLGWPLNVFVTPSGRAFFAGTYWPPDAMSGHPSFRQVLEGVSDAWEQRREEVEASSAKVAEALAAHGRQDAGLLPDAQALDELVGLLARNEDTEFGGFGTAPKFPMVPVVNFLLEQPGGSLRDDRAATQPFSEALEGSTAEPFPEERAATHPLPEERAARLEGSHPLAIADRMLTAMAGSGLRDRIEGGFFRYATRRDWTEPHYERMLYDNAQLLHAYALLAIRAPERVSFATEVASGIADYLLNVLRLPGGGFASAQNSESVVDGHLTEGDYYALSASDRAKQPPPALDEKVLTGWNGLAIGALAFAGFHGDRPDWVEEASAVASSILATQMKADGELLRATVGRRPSTARATLEDYGLLASGLLHLGLATGEVRWAAAARRLVDACLAGVGSEPGNSNAPADTTNAPADTVFAVPGGGDPVLVQQGLSATADPSESAYPSGVTALATAAHRLYLLSADRSYLEASGKAMARLAPLALQHPLGFGAALSELAVLAAPASQLVVVSDEPTSPLMDYARSWFRTGGICAVVTCDQAKAWASAGFELFEARATKAGSATAYLCQDFVCRIPVTDVAELKADQAKPA